VRGCELGLKKCQFFDAYGGCKAKINKKPIIYPCHAGLIDFASPIIMGDTQVGCFLCGQVLTEKPDENKFRLYAKELGIDEDKYIEALRKVKILPYERIEYIANFLYKISSKMSNFIYYQNMGISANEFYKNCIDEFHKHLEANENNKTENKNFSFNNILSKIKNLSYKYSESFNDAIELFDLIDFHENRFNPKRQQLLLKKISIKLRVYFVSVTKEKIEADIDFYKSDGLLYYVDSK